MNPNEIQQFFNSLKDFLQHVEVELDAHEKRQEACNYSEEIWDKQIEYLAAKYEVSVDYIIEEFML